MRAIPVSERISIIYLEKGVLERDGHTVVLKQDEVSTVLPVGKTAVLMIGPGVSVTHAAVRLCVEEKALLLWVGECGVRLYAAGEPRGLADRILRQATLRADEKSRLLIVRRLFRHMFGEDPPINRSIEQLRGIEGGRVKQIFHDLAASKKVEWVGRSMDMRDPLNLAISTATAALYGLAEAVILSLGYSPAIGFVHTGNPRSLVYDLADTVKFKTVVPLAFDLYSENQVDLERRVRTACRDLFYREQLARLLVENMEDVLGVNGID